MGGTPINPRPNNMPLRSVEILKIVKDQERSPTHRTVVISLNILSNQPYHTDVSTAQVFVSYSVEEKRGDWA